MKDYRILLVDDNQQLCDLIRKFGERTYGYTIEAVQTFDDALNKLRNQTFHLVTLDIELDDDNGLERVGEINTIFNGPIIFVSCIDEIETVVEGLQSGADDYITKPFDLDELFLRIKRSLTRSDITNTLDIENYRIDQLKNTAKMDGNALKLSPIATKILILLLLNKNKIVTREQIFEEIWEQDYAYSTRVIDTYMSHIRKETNDCRFRSIRSKGYTFDTINDK